MGDVLTAELRPGDMVFVPEKALGGTPRLEKHSADGATALLGRDCGQRSSLILIRAYFPLSWQASRFGIMLQKTFAVRVLLLLLISQRDASRKPVSSASFRRLKHRMLHRLSG